MTTTATEPTATELTTVAPSRWSLDRDGSSVGFTVKTIWGLIPVRGRFERYAGSYEVGPNGTTIELTIDAASIDTGTPDRDTHLRSADFFDVEKYPTLTFKSTRVERIDDERLRVAGDLTIRDVTREIVLDVTYGGRRKDPWGNERAGFEARASLDRKDYGLTWNQALELGGVLVGDRIELDLAIEAVKAADAKAA